MNPSRVFALKNVIKKRAELYSNTWKKRYIELIELNLKCYKETGEEQFLEGYKIAEDLLNNEPMNYHLSKASHDVANEHWNENLYTHLDICDLGKTL